MALERGAGVAVIAAGAALATAGILLMPASDVGAAKVALVPAFNGAALVGVFP